MLAQYGKTKGHDITVVFDGWKSGGLREESFVVGGIRVVYSRLGEKADSVIKRIICTGKKEWIVISSDREIAGRAWSCGCVPVPSGTFESFLEHSKLMRVNLNLSRKKGRRRTGGEGQELPPGKGRRSSGC
jgi:predicted RNA-binding protein with PIN domain